jgi:hypothetical protein
MTSIPNWTKPHAPAEVPTLGKWAVAEVIDANSLLTQDNMTSIPNQPKPHAPAEVPPLGDVAVVEVIDADSLLTQEMEQWLSYPFLGGNKVELAAKRLALCDPMTSFKTKDLITVQLKKSMVHNQIIMFSKLDRLSLDPKTDVNDNAVDFWMVWITRNERDNASSILTCTSHFYDCLTNPNFGLEHVSRWMQNRKVDIFSNDLILFPMCVNKHWSLIVTYFPGLVPNNNRNVKPVIVHLDSLKLHDAKSISGIFQQYFNYEWSKKKGNSLRKMFTTHSYPLVIPNGK